MRAKRNETVLRLVFFMLFFLFTISQIDTHTVWAGQETNGLGGYSTPESSSPNLPVLPDITAEGKTTTGVIIAYDGLFTQRYVTDSACNTNFGDNTFGKGDVKGEPTKGKIAKIFVDIISGVVRSVVGVFFGEEAGCPEASSAQFSIVTQILNLTSPLNLTQNFIIMKLISITQALSYVIALAMIVFYGIMYMTGYENMNPINFGVRMFFAMILVYFLPYLMQDILNINNIIVYQLSKIQVTFTGASDPVSTVFAGAVKNWITSMAESFLTNLLTLVLVIFMIVVAFQPLVKLFVWWYSRMIKIFFYAVVGPIMVMMMALPQTSDKASKWVKDFIGETFSQVFMVLAMAMVAFIVGNMVEFQILTNIGWLGSIIVMYACVLFLSEVPKMANTLLGGGIKGLDKLDSGVRDMGRTTTRGTKNAASGVKNAAKNVTAAATSGQRWSATSSIAGAKGIGGKTGAAVGALAAKMATARDSNNVVGGTMNKAAKKFLGKETNFQPFQTSAHQKFNSTVKPKIENSVAGRNNKKAEAAQNYQQHQNDLMKTDGGDMINMDTASMQADTEARRSAAQLLGKEGSVAGQREIHDSTTKNGGTQDALNNVIPTGVGKGPSNKPPAGGGGSGGNVPPIGGGKIPPAGGSGANQTAATVVGGTGSVGTGNATSTNKQPASGNGKGSHSDAYQTEPMTTAQFNAYDKQKMEEEKTHLTPGQTQLNSLKRQQDQAKHVAAFNGGYGGGHKNNQPSYGDMAQKIHGEGISRVNADGAGDKMDKTQSFENYLTRIGVDKNTAKNAAGELQAEAASGNSNIGTAVGYAMKGTDAQGATIQNPQEYVKEAIVQNTSLKGEAVDKLSENILKHEQHLRDIGKVQDQTQGKAEGDVVNSPTPSPIHTNGGETQQQGASRTTVVQNEASATVVESTLPTVQDETVATVIESIPPLMEGKVVLTQETKQATTQNNVENIQPKETPNNTTIQDETVATVSESVLPLTDGKVVPTQTTPQPTIESEPRKGRFEHVEESAPNVRVNDGAPSSSKIQQEEIVIVKSTQEVAFVEPEIETIETPRVRYEQVQEMAPVERTNTHSSNRSAPQDEIVITETVQENEYTESPIETIEEPTVRYEQVQEIVPVERASTSVSNRSVPQDEVVITETTQEVAFVEPEPEIETIEEPTVRYEQVQANKPIMVDRKTKNSYEQQANEPTETYEENMREDVYENDLSETPQSKQERTRQQRLYENAMTRYQNSQDITPEKVQREMRVNKKDATRIARKLNERAQKHED